LEKIHIPASVKNIHGSALIGLKSVTVEEGGKFVMEDDFLFDVQGVHLIRCFKKEPIIGIPAHTQVLAPFCFGHIEELTEVQFTEDSELKRIEIRAFGGCSSLRRIALPVSVEVLGPFSFSCCEKLTDVLFPKGSQLRRIEENAFHECLSLVSIQITAGAVFIDGTSLTLMRKVSLEEEGNFVMDGQMLLNRDRTVLVRCFNKRDWLQLLSSIEVLGPGCFSRCGSLRRVMLIQACRLKKICHGAFMYCYGLQKIHIPFNVEVIERNAFCWCTSLSDVLFEPKCQITRIEAKAFSNCPALKTVRIPPNIVYMDPEAFDSDTLVFIDK
jgi:hypothetical protein